MLIRRCFDHKDDDRFLDALGNQNSNETIKYSVSVYSLTNVCMCVCECPMLSDHTQCYENKMRQYLLLDFKAV